MASRDFGYVPRGNRRRVSERLVEVRDETIQNADGVGLHHEFVVIGIEVSGDPPRIFMGHGGKQPRAVIEIIDRESFQLHFDE